MTARSFVSIVFFPDKLQIVKLKRDKKSIAKAASFPIPRGLIVDYKIKDKEGLTTLVKNAWKQMGLSDKFVGVVVPEFSTYTKTLDMPVLERAELSEAISYRAQEFIPVPAESVVMDWRVISRHSAGVKVLVASILKTVLAEYVDVVGNAGLFPLVVETPSLSLARVAPQDEEGKILIYVYPTETVLVVVQGRAIIGSSVVRSNSPDETTRTAALLGQHYEGVKVTKIFIGGIGISQDFLQRLATAVGKPVEWLTQNVSGLSAQQVQEYMVGLSLQLKDPTEPESEHTINLLPPGWVDHYRGKLTDRRIWGITLTSAVVVWTCFLVSFMAFVLLSQGASSLESTAQATASDGEEAGVRVGEINSISERVLNISQKNVPIQNIVNEIAAAKPSGVSISTYSLSVESGQIRVQGLALTRDALLAFQKNLSDSETFGRVNLPVSALTNDRDISFDFDIELEGAGNKKESTPVKINI